VRDDHEPPV